MSYVETAGNAGLITTRRSRATGLLVSLYHSAEAGIEDDPALRYATVCEVHGIVVCHYTRRDAIDHLAVPAGWCEPCRVMLAARAAGRGPAGETYAVACHQHLDDIDVAEALTRTCPDCGTANPPHGTGHVTDSGTGYVFIGCAGTRSIPLELVELADCERCGDLHDPGTAGADPDAGLCPACTYNNDDRVVI